MNDRHGDLYFYLDYHGGPLLLAEDGAPILAEYCPICRIDPEEPEEPRDPDYGIIDIRFRAYATIGEKSHRHRNEFRLYGEGPIRLIKSETNWTFYPDGPGFRFRIEAMSHDLIGGGEEPRYAEAEWESNSDVVIEFERIAPTGEAPYFRLRGGNVPGFKVGEEGGVERWPYPAANTTLTLPGDNRPSVDYQDGDTHYSQSISGDSGDVKGILRREALNVTWDTVWDDSYDVSEQHLQAMVTLIPTPEDPD